MDVSSRPLKGSHDLAQPSPTALPHSPSRPSRKPTTPVRLRGERRPIRWRRHDGSQRVPRLGRDRGHSFLDHRPRRGHRIYRRRTSTGATAYNETARRPAGQATFAWATAPNPDGYAMAEIFQSVSNVPDADLYLNPQVQAVAQPARTGSPVSLGGSTGSIIYLLDNDVLTYYLYYQGETTPVTSLPEVTLSSSNFTSATDPMPATGMPTPVVMNSAFTVTDDGQPPLSDDPVSISDGWEELTVVTQPSQLEFTSIASGAYYPTGTEFLFSLTDDVGIQWDNLNGSQTHNFIYVQYVSDTTVHLWFQPVRVESTMTLQIQPPGGATAFVSQFAGSASTNLSLVGAAALTTTGDASTEAELDEFLGNADPVGTVDLEASTIYVSQPLEITHSVTIDGDGDTIWFDQSDEYHSGGDTAMWPSTDEGAIFVYGEDSEHIVVTLEDFTIKFDQNVSIAWSNGSGGQFDPENNPNNLDYAVINTGGTNTTEDTTTLNLLGMSIYGPPEFDSLTYAGLESTATNDGYIYAGEPAIDLVETNNGDGGISDNGQILNCPALQGGEISLRGGPWTVTNNALYGAQADTYSLAAFTFTGSHDVLLEDNSVTQQSTSGYLSRLVNFAASGIDNTVEGNTFAGGNVGFMGSGTTGGQVSADPADPGAWTYFNTPEVVLLEPNYAVLFAGRPSDVSTDGRELVLPDVRSVIQTYINSANSTGVGLVVSILSGVNSDGSPNMTAAGDWFQVSQQVSVVNGDLKLLMQDPLPQMPSGGYYVVELTTAFVDTSIIGNNINTLGTASVDVDLRSSLDFGTRIIGNDLVGGSTVVGDTVGTAIMVLATPGGNGPDGTLPANWTIMPVLGTLIEDNVIEDALGGIEIGGEHNFAFYDGNDDGPTVVSTTGRVYVTATVIGNAFEWDQQWLTEWEGIDSTSTTYGNPVGANGYPGESELPPTLTIGSGWSPIALGDVRPQRFPSAVGDNIEVNGATLSEFVDPTENEVDAQGNYSVVVASNGTTTPQPEPTGQVYDGIVNGTVVDSTITTETNTNNYLVYQGKPYFPFNVNTGLPGNPDSGNQLNISDAPSGTQGIQALMLGQDNYDLVGAGTGSPASDGIQDLHIELTGLSTSDTISSITVTDNSDAEQWVYPESGSSHQIVFDLGS